MTLDSVNYRLFIPEPGNVRVLVYQLDKTGRHVRPTADYIIGHRSHIGRRILAPVTQNDVGSGGSLAYDDIHHRLFIGDSAFGGPPGNRVLVFDLHPDRIQDYPAATHVLGQPDFETRTPGGGRKQFGRGRLVIDSASQRLFKADGSNGRVLVFDIHPDRLTNFADAKLVIGQPDFWSRETGVGRNRFGRGAGSLAWDPERQHLYVSDGGNNRILVFDVHPDRLQNDPNAIAVIGQPDFFSRDSEFVGVRAPPEERRGLRKITPGGMDFDYVNRRMFVTQTPENRILVFDLSDLKEAQVPEAILVMGQPDFTTFEPRVSQSRVTMPRVKVDSQKQLLYVSEGFPGGNRVIIFDIRPDRLTNEPAAIDVVGHVDDRGQPDFDRRMANDRADGRAGAYVRAVALDPVDHRLWAADEYNNRVLGYQLDSQNRLLDRKARWVFGQKDFNSADSTRTRTGIRIPLAVAYDEVDKRLYVGDGWNDRVLIYDVDPERLKPGGNQPAIAVLGQADFQSQDPRSTRNRFDFAVDMGRGIGSSNLPVGIAFDSKRRRAFVSDGGNNRILVFDIHKDRLRNGADAIAVLGQPDFASKEARLTANGLSSPGHLSYDPDHDRLFVIDSLNERVLVYDVAPDGLTNGMAASYVYGQPDFTTTLPSDQLRSYPSHTTPQTIPHPNGIVYDPAKQQLYVTDRGNDRILVFDAAPEKMTNQPYPITVLGQRSEESKSEQALADLSGMDQLYDPRGLAFDSENQQLYVSDSHYARIMLYNFPETSRKLSLSPRGVSTFSSLDPYVALNPREPKSGFGQLGDATEANSVYVFTKTQFEKELLTERLSRILISQSAAPAPEATSQALLFVEGRNGAVSSVFLANPGSQAASVQFTLRSGGDEETASRTLQSGTSLTATVSELMGTTDQTGALGVRSDVPVSVTAWYEGENRHGEKFTGSLPVLRSQSASSDIVPHLMVGGGYQSDIILLNPEDSRVLGSVAVFDEKGQETEVQDYEIAPGGSIVWQPADAGAVPRLRYAVARPSSGNPPALAAMVRRLDEGLISATTVEAFQRHSVARVAFNTMPDLIRHRREINLRVVIANANRLGAAVRFVLRDLDGNEVDRHEQIILPGSQRDFSLVGLFNRGQFAGSITMFSDLPVGISARQTTVNLRGEEILTELPILSGNAQGPVIYPYVDGEGHSTQLVVSTDYEGSVDSQIDFFKPDGQKLEVIIR